MTLNSLLKEGQKDKIKTEKFYRKCRDYKNGIYNILQVLDFDLDEGKAEKSDKNSVPALLKIAGSVEIGPMSSKDIDKEVYGL